MTPGAVMRRALLLMAATSALLALDCAGAQRPDDATRDAIHGHHEACNAQADLVTHLRGEDSFRYFACDAEANLACGEAGLEHNCFQWERGE